MDATKKLTIVDTNMNKVGIQKGKMYICITCLPNFIFLKWILYKQDLMPLHCIQVYKLLRDCNLVKSQASLSCLSSPVLLCYR